MLGEDAGPGEFISYVFGVRDTGGKDDGRPAPGQPVPVLDNVPDELGGIDPLCELDFIVVPMLNTNALQVRLVRCIDLRWH